MKKTLILGLVCTLFFLGFNINNVYAGSQDMYAAWITTVYNADWPSSKNNPEAQKREMINTLDNLKDAGINTVMFQVRPKADALYRSNINPWSDVLTGIQGKDPGYDPLAFVINEAHKRGMKVHAWLNPYRVTTSGTDLNTLATNNPARQHPDWVLSHDGRLYYNPELPQVKKHIYDTVAEIVRNYDVDGIHFDDYFYPANYPLPAGESRDGQVANARRNHVNEMVLGVKNTIKSIKPNVKFGVSPSGIWKNKDSDPNGSDTRGKESYYSDYADTVTWIKSNYVDYVVPQLYWNIGLNVADYSKLVNWWSNQVNGSNVDLYIGQGIYKDVVASEIDRQLQLNETYSQIKGSVFYSTSDILSNRQGCRDKIKAYINTRVSFPDIKFDYWAQNVIEDFVELGYINGYEDGTFRPDNQITRAEFVRIVNNVFGYVNARSENFPDVNKPDWYYKDVCIASNAGYINGYEDGTFRPNNPITREEAAKIVATVLNAKGDRNLTFIDSDQISNWARESVDALSDNDIINGYEDNTFRPQNNITRAETVQMLNQAR